MSQLRAIPQREVEQHNKDGDVWVTYKDKVYDLSKFYETHPGGPESIMEFAGKDSTDAFDDAGHPAYAKKQMEDFCIGTLEKAKVFTKLEEIAEHSQPGNLWLLLHDKVYDVSQFKHPGGAEILVQNAGMDATQQFEDINHSEKALKLKDSMYIGEFIPEGQTRQPSKRKSGQDGGISLPLKILLLLGFIAVFTFLYTFLTQEKPKPDIKMDV